MSTLTDIGALKEAQSGLSTWPENRLGGAGATKADFLDVVLGNIVPSTNRLTSRQARSAALAAYAPVAHFDASQGIIQSGGFVSQWNDISGNARHLLQASGANQPAYNAGGGRPYVEFNGTTHYMKCNPFTLNQPETVYLVAKQVSWTDGDFIFDGNSSSVMALFQTGGTPFVRAYAGVALAGAGTSLTIGNIGVISAVFNGASSRLRVNQQTEASGDAGSSNAGGFALGARGDGVNFSNIQVNEVLIYNVAHDATTRANVIRALMSKHGVP